MRKDLLPLAEQLYAMVKTHGKVLVNNIEYADGYNISHAYEAARELCEKGYFKQIGPNDSSRQFNATDKMEPFDTYAEALKSEREKEGRATETKEIQDKLAIKNLDNAEWTIKYRRVPYLISAGSLLVAIVALCWSIWSWYDSKGKSESIEHRLRKIEQIHGTPSQTTTLSRKADSLVNADTAHER